MIAGNLILFITCCSRCHYHHFLKLPNKEILNGSWGRAYIFHLRGGLNRNNLFVLGEGSSFKIHQILSLARDWSKRVT